LETTPGGQDHIKSISCQPKNILIPSGKEFVDIEIVNTKTMFLGDGFNVLPGSKIAPPSDVTIISEPIKNELIYNSDNFYPENIAKVVNIGFCRGFQILTINVYPVQFQSSTGSLYFHSEIQLSVKTKDTTIISSSMLRNLPEDI